MPHFGLIDERALGPEIGPLLRARLHIRGGKRRLRQGKISLGIITLADALSSALEWYLASGERTANLSIYEGEDLRDDYTAYKVLVRSNVLDGSFDFKAFDRLLERALYEELSLDPKPIVEGIDSIMTQLGVMPFDEGELPPEDPSAI
jgi:hypothetical protein